MDDLDDLDDLERWAADARAQDAAAARVRERWLRTQGEEEASLAGVLLAMAERHEAVVLTTVDGRRHRGLMAGVGVDFCAVTAPGGTTTLLALHALADARSVPPAGRRRASTAGDGHERASLGVLLADVLAQAAGQRPRVSVRAGATSVTGDLRSVGHDVLAVRADGATAGAPVSRSGPAGTVYVRLPSVSEISFLASG